MEESSPTSAPEEKPLPHFVKPSKKKKKKGEAERPPTRFLFISKADTSRPRLLSELADTFSQFGSLDSDLGPVCVNWKRHVCYVCFQEEEACRRALIATQEGEGVALGDGIRLICKYADLYRPQIPPPEPECVSATDDVLVPGLTLLQDFISPEEEEFLIDFCDNRNSKDYFAKDGKRERKNKEGGYWENTLSRRVQHFGYRFNYDTLSLDCPQDMCPVPSFLTDMIKSKLRKRNNDGYNVTQEKGLMNEKVDEDECVMTQMTINEYFPGQGIAPHIDRPDCFGPVIYIISLGCDITMTLTDNSNGKPTSILGRAAGPVEQDEIFTKKHIWLPARSLLVLRGDARYKWVHAIAPRTMDKLNGELLRRKRRISLTIREGIYIPKAHDVELARVHSQLEKATVNTQTGKSTKTSELTPDEEAAILNQLQNQEPCVDHKGPSQLEKEHVFKVYDEIAQHWHHTRGKRKVYWQVVKAFLESLPPGSLIADVGCGDGKYFGVGHNIVSIGCDRSSNLLKVSRDPSNATFCCDAVEVPLVSNRFDAALCIAVLHHLGSVERRVAVITEIVRLLQPGGRALIQAWALEQDAGSKRQFKKQDVLVPWKLQQKFVRESWKTREESESAAQSQGPMKPREYEETLVFQRFCHVYKEGELEMLIESVENCQVIESGYDKSNWFVIIQKT